MPYLFISDAQSLFGLAEEDCRSELPDKDQLFPSLIVDDHVNRGVAYNELPNSRFSIHLEFQLQRLNELRVS